MQQIAYTIINNSISIKDDRNNNNYIWHGKRITQMTVPVARLYIQIIVIIIRRRIRRIWCSSGSRYNNTGWYPNTRRRRSNSGKDKVNIDNWQTKKQENSNNNDDKSIHPIIMTALRRIICHRWYILW